MGKKTWSIVTLLVFFALGLFFVLGMNGTLGEWQEAWNASKNPRETFRGYPGAKHIFGFRACGDLGQIQYSYRMEEWVGDYIKIVQDYDYSSDDPIPYISVTKYGDYSGFDLTGEFTDVYEGETSSGIPYKEYSVDVVNDTTLLLHFGDGKEKRLDFDYIEECNLVR